MLPRTLEVGFARLSVSAGAQRDPRAVVFGRALRFRVPSSQQRPATPLKEPGAPLRVIPIQYDAALTAAGFPSAVAHVNIRGQSAWLIIDTGAGVNTLASWFVDRAGIVSSVAESGATDSTGREVPLKVAHDVSGLLDNGSSLSLKETIVADFPPIFEQHQLGGLLSPQLLASSENAAVLDLRRPELRFEPLDGAVARLRAEALVPPDDASICVNRDSPFANRLFASPVVVGGTSASLLIDSGATSTILAPGSPAGLAIAPQSIPAGGANGVGGQTQSLRKARGVRVQVGGDARVTDFLVGAVSPGCGGDGLLGMDLLRSCAIVLGEGESVLICRFGG
jgi:hypothetical protein